MGVACLQPNQRACVQAQLSGFVGKQATPMAGTNVMNDGFGGVSHPLNGPISSSVSIIYVSQCEVHQCALWDLDAGTGRSDPVDESRFSIAGAPHGEFRNPQGAGSLSPHPQ